MNQSPTPEDLQKLSLLFKSAIAVRDEIDWKTGYPNYPKPIGVLMDNLTSPPWRACDYLPSETKAILARIDSATMKEVRSALTAIARSERFCDGAWDRVLREGTLEALIGRARELIETRKD